MRGRHLFAGAGRATGPVRAAVATLALGLGIAAPAAAHHWQPGMPAHRIHSWHNEHLSSYGEGQVTPVVTGLNQPKKLTFGPAGGLYVALSGSGAPSSDCTLGEEPACINESGEVIRISPSGHVTKVLENLPSISSEGEATGPAEAGFHNGGLEVLFQDEDLDETTGESDFGSAGALLGTFVRYGLLTEGPWVRAKFGPFEATHNPDKGAGSGVEFGQESAIDSDPYSYVPFDGGYVIADAAANDLLYLGPLGNITVLAVFPTIPETAPPGSLGPEQTTPVPVTAQAVPDTVAVGPDGALYVGELGGFPFNTGTSSIYRVVPGHAPTLYASGFTAISDIAFDSSGRMLVLEIDQAGLLDPAAETGLPTPGALIGIHPDGSKSLLASTGLEYPTGLAVSPHGHVYVSNYGVLPATGGPEGLSGQVDRVHLPSSWVSHP
jgi:hypothetical protein